MRAPAGRGLLGIGNALTALAGVKQGGGKDKARAPASWASLLGHMDRDRGSPFNSASGAHVLSPGQADNRRFMP
jgi:hypothetical protein